MNKISSSLSYELSLNVLSQCFPAFPAVCTSVKYIDKDTGLFLCYRKISHHKVSYKIPINCCVDLKVLMCAD